MSSPQTGTTPETLVQRSTDAYNAHDAAAFAAVYASDLQLLDFGGDLYLFGRDALQERYAQLFASAPAIAVEIRKRIVVGNVVIDEEYITGTASGRPAHLAVMYEIAGDLIKRVWVARE
jgi:uncharacterized protein (TIGR02246 family)